ncbi:glutamine synthetase [Elysia marginata]|uniref:Lengsin n=1 Tax=Elysia marginata TaxID=1093978 RepID=A0AAV4JNA1_9GAST|nr:glutamine synthetase [Elysia marginata]
MKGMSNRHPAFTTERVFSNMKLTPVLSTLKPCQKSVFGSRKVGSIICELRFPEDGTLDTSSPREATQAVLEKLQSEFGLRIKSSFEVEFGIRNSKTQLLDHGRKWGSLTVLESGQDYLMDLMDDLRDIGVKVDTLLTERGNGQYEVTFEIVDGIEVNN